ncbi:MAG TPA: sialidase family protein, partial [Armatimonadota bacterium]|nr:sialidase family protein [Armatimonadota bacterium]
RKEGIYACFPSLTHMPGGRLFANFGTRSRRSHIDNTGGTARMISEDGGYTWEPVDKAPDHPRYTREDGTKFVPHARGWVYVDESELPSIKARNRRWMKARPGTVAYLGDPQVAITHPDGKYETLTLDSPVPGGCMSYHHASSFLRKGDLWMTAIYCATGTDGMTGVWVIRSEDNAETWEVVHVAGPVGDRHGLGEAALCDNGQGEIICVMRSGEGGKHNTHQSFSSDGGKTWSAALDTGIWGYPANVILLSDGRLLCSYGYRRDAMGIRAVLSEDGGHTWDRLNEIVIRADGHGHGGDNGYPISVQMDDGHIFTIYYLNDKDDVTHVAGTHWTLPQGPGQF